MLYIGIDPGASWCGFAAMELLSPKSVRVEARTYDVQARRGYLQMTKDILDMIPRGRETTFIAEDFRIRKSGHQRFSRGDTLRFLGALEYGVSCRPNSHFYLVQPNDHGEKETRELFGRVLLKYRGAWPEKTHATWGHCVSAWRVLGNHLMFHNRDVLLTILEYQKSHRCDRWLPTLLKSKQLDRIAPAAIWK